MGALASNTSAGAGCFAVLGRFEGMIDKRRAGQPGQLCGIDWQVG